MKYLMRDYIYGWHWENFKASYEHGNSAIFKFLAVQLIFMAQIIKTVCCDVLLQTQAGTSYAHLLTYATMSLQC